MTAALTSIVSNDMMTSNGRILAQGHSVVVDAVFAREAERDAIQDAPRKLNVRFVGLFLTADFATRVKRVGRRQRDASDATLEIAAIQEKYNLGAVGWAAIDASGAPEQTLKLCQLRIAHDEAAGAG